MLLPLPSKRKDDRQTHTTLKSGHILLDAHETSHTGFMCIYAAI